MPTSGAALARAQDAIPIAVSSADRDAQFPAATVAEQQRVFRADTGVQERWVGGQWIADSVNAATLVPTGRAPALSAAQYVANNATFNVRDYGAAGDGLTNDTTAFQLASAALQAAGGGTLLIPPGTYIVATQTRATAAGQQWAYVPQSIISITGCTRAVDIAGYGATLRTAPGLRYGAYSRVTGLAISPALPYTVLDDRASPYNFMVAVTNCVAVSVRGLELDGNCGSLVLGGNWGDTGRQVAGTGLYLFGNQRVSVVDVYAHHHPLDGLMVGYAGLTDASPRTPHEFRNVVSEYNCRQGFSWVGGIGFTWVNCKFNHTGRGGFASNPSAGLDIEAESSVCRGGLAVNCEFVNNVGCGVVADSGDGGHTTFQRSLFWGTGGGPAVWARKPNMVFEDCTIYGDVLAYNGAANKREGTHFLRCHIEDRDHPTFGAVYRSGFLINFNGGNCLQIEDTEIIANACKTVFIVSPPAITAASHVRRTRVVCKNAGYAAADFQVLWSGVVLEHVEIVDAFTTAVPSPPFYVELGSNGVVVERGVVVPATVKWGNATAGTSGTIARTP